jgi:hypothetical protein
MEMSMDICTEKMDVDDACGPRTLKDSRFFYSDDNYFKGMLVRLRLVDQLNVNLKVYIR